MVAASFVFYGWWDWRFLFLVSFTSFCSWGCGMLVRKYREEGGEREHCRVKAVTTFNIVVNLLILGLFKYYDFFAQSFADLFLGGKSDGLLLNIILPIGISFYTFKALSYTIDVYKGKIEPTRDIVQFFAFVSFFPQLLAGPIERSTTLLPQFGKERKFDYDEAVDGMRQILWGLFKKVVIADNCAVYVDKIFDTYQTQSGSTLLVAAIMFTFQIYGDFSGYSDMSIGTSKLFSISSMKNFNVPYFSRDIAEFWRRWHISLTTWFRDYVYIPLGGSRCSKRKIVRNAVVIFLLSGLWHGANWTFLVWGAYNAVLFLPLILFKKNRKHPGVVAQDRCFPNIKELQQMLITFFLAVFGWIIFRSDSIRESVDYISSVFSRSLFSMPDASGITSTMVAILILIVIEWVQRNRRHGLDLSCVKSEWVRVPIYLGVLFLTFAFGGHSENFIYFQF